jgi:hypothetical protein
MTSIFFNKRQNEIFNKQFENYNDDIKYWNLINVFIPCLIISIPALLYSFLPNEKANFGNLILNGSFSLLGINILFTMSNLLVNSINLKDTKLEKEIIGLRLKLIIYLIFLLIIGSIFYILQIIANLNTSERIFTILLGFSLTLYFSIGIGKRIYIIKDELIGTSISEDITQNVNELENSLDDLD